MPVRPDDAAQIALRALLAWPVLGLTAAALTPVVVDRFVVGAVHLELLLFGAGGGLGAGLAAATAGLLTLGLTRLLRRRGPWPIVELGLLALLAPLTLLGGVFASDLAATGSSRETTTALVTSHLGAPLELLDLDAAVSMVVVTAGLIVGRARGWRLRTQAAVGAGLCLPALALRTALGGLDRTPVGLVVAVELALAAAVPFVVAAADRTVRQARLLLAGVARPDAPRRLLHFAACMLAPLVVAAATCGLLSWHGRPRAPVVGLGLLLALLTPGPYLVVRARYALHSGSLRINGSHIRAVALVFGASAAFLGLVVFGAATGLQLRAAAALALGLDPVQVAHEVEDASQRAPVWQAPGLMLPSPGVADPALTGVLQAAADLGDVRACRVVTSETCVERSLIEAKVRWLRQLVAAGDLVGAERMLRKHHERTGEEEGAAVDVILAAATRGDPAAGEGLRTLWTWVRHDRSRQFRRLDAVLAADPERWFPVFADCFRGGCCVPGAPAALERWVVARSRVGLVIPNPGGYGPSNLLLSRLSRDPALTRAGDGYLVSCATPIGPAWPDLLLGLELGPLDPERAPALAAAARGDWASVWSASTAVLEVEYRRDAYPDRARAFRARIHALLDEARRTGGSRDGALHLARAHLEAARSAYDSGTAFDEALLSVHETVEGCRKSDPAGLVARIDFARALGPDDATVARRTETLRGVVIDLFGAPAPEKLAQHRQEDVLRLRYDGHPAAAARLEALPP